MKQFWIAFLMVAALTFSSIAAFAQQPQVTVGQPFRVVMAHDGVQTTGYRLYVDEQRVGPDHPVSIRQNGEVRIEVPGVATRGVHSVRVAAFNPDQEAISAPLAFTAVQPSPNPPTNLRIELIATINADGGVQLRVEHVRVVPPEE